MGYGAHNRQVHPANIFSDDWQSCREKASHQIEKNYKNLRRSQGEPTSKNTSEYEKPYKKFEPIVGYRGFISRINADNLFGRNYHDILGDSNASLSKLSYWKNKELSSSEDRI